MKIKYCIAIVFVGICCSTSAQKEKAFFSSMDIFSLQYVQEPRISPDGGTVVYRRMQMDIQQDAVVGNLWRINYDGSGHEKLTNYNGNESGVTWSPSGDRIAFIRKNENGHEIYLYWVASGKTARLTQLNQSPSSLSWSPDGKFIAFRMKMLSDPPELIEMPEMPKGAQWADAARVTDRLYHESDGNG